MIDKLPRRYKRLQLPEWVNPDRHITASGLFPYRHWDPSQRWKTSYGIRAHKHIVEKEGLEHDDINKIFKISEFDITVGYRYDGIKNNCIYEIKESAYFKKYPLDCIVQANLYKIAEKCTDCKIITYRINESNIQKPPSNCKIHDIKQMEYSDLIKSIEPYVRAWLRKSDKLDCYR